MSTNAGYTIEHWIKIRQIISDSVGDVGFDSQMVGDSESVTIIHKTMYQNLHDLPMVFAARQ